MTYYIREHVLDSRRNGHYNSWSKKMRSTHHRYVCWLYRLHNIDHHFQISCIRCRISCNARNQPNPHKEKFVIRIPKNSHEALHLDKQNGNTKWAEAIDKEMSGLNRLKAFIYHSPNKVFPKAEGWKFAPIHMIFTIKQEGSRYKARLVAGGGCH